MSLRFTVLASGSRGNANVLQAAGRSLLLDAGLNPKDLLERMSLVGLRPGELQGMLLTHTHSDHWNASILSWLHKHSLPLWCHPSHHGVLSRASSAFQKMKEADLIRSFEAGVPIEPLPGVSAVPLAVRHDSEETFGFRLDGQPDLFGRSAAIGYAADLGCWDARLVEAFRDVDLLAIEFNHDTELEKRSKRPSFLVERVLGDEGHLSNEQAADFVRVVMEHSAVGRLQHLVQLHLSADCNRPELARRAVKNILAGSAPGVRLHTAEQNRPGKVLRVEAGVPLLLGDRSA